MVNRDLVGNVGAELRLDGVKHETRSFLELVVALSEGGIKQLCQYRNQLLFLLRRECRPEVLADDVAQLGHGFIEICIGLFLSSVARQGDGFFTVSRQPDLLIDINQFRAQIAENVVHRLARRILCRVAILDVLRDGRLHLLRYVFGKLAGLLQRLDAVPYACH